MTTDAHIPQTRPKRKALHFVNDLHMTGGLRYYLQCLLPEMQRRDNYDVVLVCSEGAFMYNTLKELGVKVIGIPGTPKRFSLKHRILSKPFFRTVYIEPYLHLKNILAAEKPDVVTVHIGRVENALIKLFGYRLTYTYHGYGSVYNLEAITNPIFKLYSSLMRPLFSLMIPFLDGMITVSDYERKRNHREGYVPRSFEPTVVYNGIPMGEFQQRVNQTDSDAYKTKLGVPLDKKVITFISRLDKDKYPDRFLEVAKRIVQNPKLRDSVHFLIAGSGAYAPQFTEAFKSDADLGGRGTFLGFRDDIPELLAVSDVVVSLTLHEGFGIRILEAIASGTPCVSYAAGGIPEVMNCPDAQPWLIKPGDEDALFKSLVDVLEYSPEHCQQINGRLQDYARKFDISCVAQDVENFYDKILMS